MPPLPHRPARLLPVAFVAALAMVAPAGASDAPMRKVRCYGLNGPVATETTPPQQAAADDKPAKAKPTKKPKKDYEVMRARDCALAGGRLGAPK